MKWTADVVYDGEVFRLETPLPLVAGRRYLLTIVKELTKAGRASKPQSAPRRRARRRNSA
jgi:hypothetical protein